VVVEKCIFGGVQDVTCPACRGTGLYELPCGESFSCSEWDCNGTGTVMGWAIEVNGIRIESTDEGCKSGIITLD